MRRDQGFRRRRRACLPPRRETTYFQKNQSLTKLAPSRIGARGLIRQPTAKSSKETTDLSIRRATRRVAGTSYSEVFKGSARVFKSSKNRHGGRRGLCRLFPGGADRLRQEQRQAGRHRGAAAAHRR